MKPSEQCKAAGLKSLKQLSEITGKPTRTLINWHKTDQKLFQSVIYGAVNLAKDLEGKAT